LCLVARRAQDLLASESQTALTKALNELAVLKSSHSSLTVHESSHPFTECATWADDYKGTYSFQAGWHFIDQPYLDKGGSLSDFSFTPD
jgi:hypothetical protein